MDRLDRYASPGQIGTQTATFAKRGNWARHPFAVIQSPSLQESPQRLLGSRLPANLQLNFLSCAQSQFSGRWWVPPIKTFRNDHRCWRGDAWLRHPLLPQLCPTITIGQTANDSVLWGFHPRDQAFPTPLANPPITLVSQGVTSLLVRKEPGDGKVIMDAFQHLGELTNSHRQAASDRAQSP